MAVLRHYCYCVSANPPGAGLRQGTGPKNPSTSHMAPECGSRLEVPSRLLAPWEQCRAFSANGEGGGSPIFTVSAATWAAGVAQATRSALHALLQPQSATLCAEGFSDETPRARWRQVPCGARHSREGTCANQLVRRKDTSGQPQSRLACKTGGT